MRRFDAPRPFLLLLRVPILRHSDTYVTNFTASLLRNAVEKKRWVGGAQKFHHSKAILNGRVSKSDPDLASLNRAAAANERVTVCSLNTHRLRIPELKWKTRNRKTRKPRNSSEKRRVSSKHCPDNERRRTSMLLTFGHRAMNATPTLGVIFIYVGVVRPSAHRMYTYQPGAEDKAVVPDNTRRTVRTPPMICTSDDWLDSEIEFKLLANIPKLSGSNHRQDRSGQKKYFSIRKTRKQGSYY
ncbi:hypothetical protein EVAR_33842_1 [Eumeta japonica]|uniref:Uncharacterized protein n=1 Tax=Eumeta variegata TaxID=151549 RepID=A0A4C1VAK8_EUMVA|nr:hypothetical protein EVAR_33842_1 [Eumeta japonica]